jgi:hypothetical protein
MIHNELVLLVCFSTVDDMNLLIWCNPIHYKKSNILITLLVYQYCTKFWKQFTILEQIVIPVLCTILVYQYCNRQVQEIQVLILNKTDQNLLDLNRFPQLVSNSHRKSPCCIMMPILMISLNQFLLHYDANSHDFPQSISIALYCKFSRFPLINSYCIMMPILTISLNSYCIMTGLDIKFQRQ